MNDLNLNRDLNKELNVVYRYLRKSGISNEDAQDIVQETAYKYLLYYDSIQSFKIRSWLIRVSLNLLYDHFRKQKHYEYELNEDLFVVLQKDLPEEIIIKKEKRIEIDKALSLLKPQYKELLMLKYQSSLKYDEISKLMGLSVGTIKTNLFRARKQFAKNFRRLTNE